MVVDDRAAFRSAIRLLLRAARPLELVGEADCGERALAVIDECDPDLVLVDVRMPGMGGLTAARTIKRRRPSTVVVLISAAHPSELPVGVASCGADAVVWKPDLRPGVLDAIWLDHRPSHIT